MSVSTSKKVGASLAVSVLLLSALGASSLRAARRTAEASRWVQHTQDVEGDLSSLSGAIAGAESATRGYVLTGDARYLAAYGGSPTLVREQLRELRRMTADNPTQQRHLDVLEPLVEAKVAWLARVGSAARERGSEAAVALIRTNRGHEMTIQIRAEIRAMEREEERLLRIRDETQTASAANMRRFILLTLTLGFGFLAVAGVVIERDLVGRRRAEAALRSLSLVDELTGLANRRGFFLHAGDRVGIADRLSGSEVLYFADLDGLKAINDMFGHGAGDEALLAAAAALRGAFGPADVVARLGGDEFVVLGLLGPGETPEGGTGRIHGEIAKWNALAGRKFRLAMSVGVVPVSPGTSLDDLLAIADRQMYEEKRARGRARPREAGARVGTEDSPAARTDGREREGTWH